MESGNKSENIAFEYPEDWDFFVRLLNGGNKATFDEKYKDLFDFRAPKAKRVEFNKIRKQLLKELIERYGHTCQLQIHKDCSKDQIWHVDHIIPLATNELNKKLRGMKRHSSQKVPAQSFGSNHRKNLIVACQKCNYFKKHRFILPIKFYK